MGKDKKKKNAEKEVKQQKIPVEQMPKRMSHGEFKENLLNALQITFGEQYAFRVDYGILTAARLRKNGKPPIISGRYKFQNLYTDYINISEDRCTATPFKYMAEWIAARLAFDLSQKMGKEIKLRPIGSSYDAINKSSQEIPAINVDHEREEQYRAWILNKTNAQVEELCYEQEFSWSNQNLIFHIEDGGEIHDLRITFDELRNEYERLRRADDGSAWMGMRKYLSNRWDKYEAELKHARKAAARQEREQEEQER